MQSPSLGERIKELRTKLGISLRELARRSKISAPHLSDIELGRRYPSEDALERLAIELGVKKDDLGKLDARDSLTDLRRMLTLNPSWGMAFRKMAEQGKEAGLTPEQVMKRLSK